MAQLTVFHTSDFHNKLTPDQAEHLHALKAAHPGSLMLDSGDAIWSGNIYWRPGGEPILDLMNSVPYDALCMGNREYHFLGIGVNSKTSRASFPILSANMRAVRGSLARMGEGWGEGETSRARPFLAFERGGMRIAMMGLTVPCITERMLVKKVSDYYFEQPVAAAAELVPKLRGEFDLVIALTHIGIAKDRELAERVPGIDVILGGHTHTITEKPERVGDTWILHHGFYAHYAGKVEIDVENGRVGLTDELIPLAKA